MRCCFYCASHVSLHACTHINNNNHQRQRSASSANALCTWFSATSALGGDGVRSSSDWRWMGFVIFHSLWVKRAPPRRPGFLVLSMVTPVQAVDSHPFSIMPQSSNSSDEATPPHPGRRSTSGARPSLTLACNDNC